MPLLYLIRNFKLRHAGYVFVVLLIVVIWWQHETFKITQNRLDLAQEALKRPKTRQSTSKVVIVQPARIVTRYIERPSGEKETITDESRFGEMTWTGQESDSQPATLEQLVGGTAGFPQRQNRWLLGISNRNVEARRWDHYGIWGGYSIANRLDGLIGVTYNDGAEFNLMAIARF